MAKRKKILLLTSKSHRWQMRTSPPSYLMVCRSYHSKTGTSTGSGNGAGSIPTWVSGSSFAGSLSDGLLGRILPRKNDSETTLLWLLSVGDLFGRVGAFCSWVTAGGPPGRLSLFAIVLFIFDHFEGFFGGTFLGRRGDLFGSGGPSSPGVPGELGDRRGVTNLYPVGSSASDA